MVESMFDHSGRHGRVEIHAGVGLRRRWTAAQKAVVVAESFAPGAVGIARRPWSTCRSSLPARPVQEQRLEAERPRQADGGRALRDVRAPRPPAALLTGRPRRLQRSQPQAREQIR